MKKYKNQDWQKASQEAIEDVEIMKDYKWKLGMMLNDKINLLNDKINEINEKKRLKEIEFNKESKVYESKIKNLLKLIKNEETEGFLEEYNINMELQKKKDELVMSENKLSQEKMKLKKAMMQKFNHMLELKQQLQYSVNELLVIKQYILSRKFAMNDEDSKEESGPKMDPEELNLLHLSQNIGEQINKNLIIK